jgi:hypothetical protein
MTVTVKPKYSRETLSQRHFVHQKSNMEWCAIEPGVPRLGADN